MNYDNEDWIKVYTRDSVGWLALSWQARGLALEIARKIPKKTGELPLGRRGLEAVAILLRCSWTDIEPYIRELIQDGRLEYDTDRQILRDPQHIERQITAASAAERQRRRRAALAAYQASNDVTPSHAASRDVTPSHAASLKEKRREEKKREEKNPPKPPGGGQGGVGDEVHEHYVQSLKAIRPRRRPPALSSKDRKAIAQHLRDGLTVDDLKRAVEGLMRSPHHLGENDRRTEYLELEYALRKPTQMAALVPEPRAPDPPRAGPVEPGVPPPPGVLEAMEKFITETGT